MVAHDNGGGDNKQRWPPCNPASDMYASYISSEVYQTKEMKPKAKCMSSGCPIQGNRTGSVRRLPRQERNYVTVWLFLYSVRDCAIFLLLSVILSLWPNQYIGNSKVRPKTCFRFLGLHNLGQGLFYLIIFIIIKSHAHSNVLASHRSTKNVHHEFDTSFNAQKKNLAASSSLDRMSSYSILDHSHCNIHRPT